MNVPLSAVWLKQNWGVRRGWSGVRDMMGAFGVGGGDGMGDGVGGGGCCGFQKRSARVQWLSLGAKRVRYRWTFLTRGNRSSLCTCLRVYTV